MELWERAGVHRCVFWLQPGAPDAVEREVDEIAAAVQRLG